MSQEYKAQCFAKRFYWFWYWSITGKIHPKHKEIYL